MCNNLFLEAKTKNMYAFVHSKVKILKLIIIHDRSVFSLLPATTIDYKVFIKNDV